MDLRLDMDVLMGGLKKYFNHHTRPLSKLFTASTPSPLQSISGNVRVSVVRGFYGSVPSVAFLASRGFKINTVLTNIVLKVGKAVER